MTNVKRTDFSIQRMSSADIAPALCLCRECGWNQLREDWQRLLDYDPTGCFVAICDGKLAGTVTTTRYGRDLGWIGMMLVDPTFRRRRIATALIQHSVRYLKSRSVRCIQLDATPHGELVYRKLGFECDWKFHRWSREESAAGIQTNPPNTSTHLPDAAVALDQSEFGADRRDFLNLLVQASYIHVMRDGYGMLRPGFLASYLGPVCATTPTIAESIITVLCRRADQTMFWDIPTPNRNAIRIARSLGFAPIRDLMRMSLVGTRSDPDLRLQYALADPAAG
jgi:ribosomal protein S18 acetylase RimI-like enzyme